MTALSVRARFAVSAIVLAAACAFTVWLALLVVDRVYAGELFPQLFQNRATQPIGHYYGVVTRTVLGAYLFVALATTLFWIRRYRSALLVLSVLVAGDVMFCILSETYGGLLSVRVDRGIPEWFQYLKELSLAVLLFGLHRRTGRTFFLLWSGFFAFLFADDALRYHEQVGALLADQPIVQQLAQPLEVRALDIGEMISVVPVLGVFVLGCLMTYVREGVVGRRAILTLSACIAALVFFGGAMDIIDRVAVTRGSDLVRLLSLIEDGGEMIVLSATLSYVAAMFWRRIAVWRTA